MKTPNCPWCGEKFYLHYLPTLRESKDASMILRCDNNECAFQPNMGVTYKTRDDAIGAATLPNPNFANVVDVTTTASMEMIDAELKANREMIMSQEMTMEEFEQFMRD